MARPHPNPRAYASRLARTGLGALALALVPACTSDEPLDSTTELHLSTSEAMTDIIPFTTGGGEGESSTGEYDDPLQSCRRAINCVFQCVLDLDPTPGQEEDLSCFRECMHGLTTEEVLGLIELTVCVTDSCFADMICTEHGENDDEACRNCIVTRVSAMNPYHPACEAEGMACK